MSCFGLTFGLSFMKLKRRDFIFLGSLTSLGLIFSGKFGREKPAFSRTGFTPPPTAEEQATLTALKLNKPLFRFVSVADTGTGGTGQYAVANAMNRYHEQTPFDMVLLAGDNIYNNGEISKVEQVFEKPYQKLLEAGVKFYACLGNHDVRTDNGDPQVKYPKFNMDGRRFYTFRRDNLQFFALDTNRNADWKTQLPWLENELSKSDAVWKIVFGHHPCYSSGMHGSNVEIREILAPLFLKYGVQLYINGHDHNYERIRSINGTTFLTCGAGADTRPVGRSEVTAYSRSELSFVAYDVYAGHIVLSAIDPQNQIFDQGVVLMGKV